MKDLYIGAIINVHARQLKITEAADAATKDKLAHTSSHTFAMIKPDALHNVGEILTLIHEHGFTVKDAKMISLSRSDAAKFYAEHEGSFSVYIS